MTCLFNISIGYKTTLAHKTVFLYLVGVLRAFLLLPELHSELINDPFLPQYFHLPTTLNLTFTSTSISKFTVWLLCPSALFYGLRVVHKDDKWIMVAPAVIIAITMFTFLAAFWTSLYVFITSLKYLILDIPLCLWYRQSFFTVSAIKTVGGLAGGREWQAGFLDGSTYTWW